MRRWHAVPVAVLTALTIGMALFATATPVRAGNPPAFILSVDCDSTSTSDTSIQAACAPPNGTTSATVGIVLTNQTGASLVPTGFGFTLTAGSGLTSTAAPGANTAAVGAGYDCTTGGPPTQAPESLNCFLGIGQTGATVAGGASILLSRFTYTIPSDVSTTYTLSNGLLSNAAAILIDSCADFANGANACFDATLAVGGGVVPTNTPTSPAGPTDTPTPTNTAVPSATPCQQNCPTNTPQNFVTVTPTPGAETATVPAGTGETPAAPPPGGPGGAGTPSGNTGGAGGRPIRLPDTGSGSGNSIDWSTASLLALIALAAGGVAGGAYVMAARRSSRDGR